MCLILGSDVSRKLLMTHLTTYLWVIDLGLKSTLKVFNAATVKTVPGIVNGQSVKPLVGIGGEVGSERVRLRLVSMEPGVHEHLHWHLIEGCYYVISGCGFVKDINGKTHEVGPGTVVYAPPGLVAAHSWDIKEKLQLVSIRASNDHRVMYQFSVDENTKRSYVDIRNLERWHATSFEKSLYP